MQINLPETGTLFFISDHCHVIENVCINPHSKGEQKLTVLLVAGRHSPRLAGA